MNAVVGQIGIIQSVIQRAQEKLDAFAVSRGYDSIVTLCSYANDPDPIFSAEGQYGILKRSQMWSALRQVQDDALAGLRPIPRSFDELESEPGLLPALDWTKFGI
jgi:hypothetical protein